MSDVINVVGETVMFLCPACGNDVHAVKIKAGAWTWNRSMTVPTFTPSVRVNKGQLNARRPECHSYVREGQIQYLNDCTHDLAGETVPLPPWSDRFAGDN